MFLSKGSFNGQRSFLGLWTVALISARATRSSGTEAERMLAGGCMVTSSLSIVISTHTRQFEHKGFHLEISEHKGFHLEISEHKLTLSCIMSTDTWLARLV